MFVNGRIVANCGVEFSIYLGDKLPTVYDAAIQLFKMATRPKSERMHKAILSYRNNLILMWHRSFGKEHTLSIPAVTRKLELIVNSYNNQVYTKCGRVKPKHANEVLKQKRMLNKTWRLAPISDCKMKKGKGNKQNNDLLDIGKDMDKLTGREKMFYQDQLRERECRLSEEIDDEYELDCQHQCEEKVAEERREEAELSFINSPEFEENYTPRVRCRGRISDTTTPRNELAATSKTIIGNDTTPEKPNPPTAPTSNTTVPNK